MKPPNCKSLDATNDQLMMEMFDAVFRTLCPGNAFAEEHIFHRTEPRIARHAVIGLTCLLLTYTVQDDEDMAQVFDDFVRELRGFFLADGMTPFVAPP